MNSLKISQRMLWLAGILVVLVLATNQLSAFLRLQEAGVGCQPWPDCYARIGVETERPDLQAALTPHQGIKRAHRLVAAVMVLVVLVILHQSRQQRLAGVDATLPYAIAAVMLLLAVVGPASYLKTLPAIATANLLGGMVLLGLSWRWLMAVRRPWTAPGAGLLALAGLGAVLAQSALGAWTSANFAAAACGGVVACALPEGDGLRLQAFNYFRELPLDATGRVLMGTDAWLIHHAHRAGAWLASLVLVIVAIRLPRRDPRYTHHGAIVLTLLALQIGIGLLGVANQLPLAAVLAHNLLAALLVVVFVDIGYRTVPHD
jgi:heme a synthase